MNLKYVKEKVFPVIKVISIVAIVTAIGLELWNGSISLFKVAQTDNNPLR
jgi:hypothetical protein